MRYWASQKVINEFDQQQYRNRKKSSVGWIILRHIRAMKTISKAYIRNHSSKLNIVFVPHTIRTHTHAHAHTGAHMSQCNCPVIG